MLVSDAGMAESSKARIGVLAADQLRSLGLMTILQETAGLEPVERTLAEVLSDHEMGALLIDGEVHSKSLLDLVSVLRHERPDMKLLVVGRVEGPQDVQTLIGAGVRGYLTETASEDEIRMAITVVLDGSVWAPRKVLARLLDQAEAAAPVDREKLRERLIDLVTPREREVLNLLMRGRSNREIAHALLIDEVTVKAHLGRMLRKAGASNRVELTLRAMEEQGPAQPSPR